MNSTKPTSRGGRIAACVLLLFAVILAIAASQIKYSFSSDPLGPRAYPLVLAVLIGLCGVWYWFSPGENEPVPSRAALIKTIAFLALAVATTGLMPWIGFIAAMAILCAGMARMFEATWIAAWVSGVVQAVVWWALFGPLLGGNLPKGPWGF